MSSASAASPTLSGAPNASRGFGFAASPTATGRPLATTRVLPGAEVSRCDSSGASARRPTVIRQRWRGSSDEVQRRAPRLVVCGTMNEPAPSGPAASGTGAAGIPPPPFIRPHVPGQPPSFAPVSPRVVLLIVAGLVLGLLLWMARDAVRPFIVGLLFVYLLDPLVRRLAATGLRRSLAILVVYVGAFAAFTAFLWVTVGPLIDEMLRFIADFPAPGRTARAPAPAAVRPVLASRAAGRAPRVDRPDHRRDRQRRWRGRRSPLDLSWLLPDREWRRAA